MRPISLLVNGQTHQLTIPDDEALVTTLRDRLNLRSVRPTCGMGICGTCTVQLDGVVVSSCLMLTRQTVGSSILTSEGLKGKDGSLSRVQRAFVDSGAYQCSYCIPGMVMTVEACLAENPSADLEEVREYLAGNLCRCGTYVTILEAVADLVEDARTKTGS